MDGRESPTGSASGPADGGRDRDTIDAAKQAVRERVWNLLEAEHAVDPGVHGHIPDFVGATAAAERLAGLPAWRDAQIVKAVPDTPNSPSELPRHGQKVAEQVRLEIDNPKLSLARERHLGRRRRTR